MATWQRSVNGGGGGNGALPTDGPRAKCDQVVYECVAKAAEIIVGARTTYASSRLSQDAYKHNSSRFNLLVPEIEGVRSILQRWRRALHVPLRLDVYYQHAAPDGTAGGEPQRELLERWALEYQPHHHPNAAGISQQQLDRELGSSPDPIAQLRHVCKRIVIWLRTLYCLARLLPAAVAASHSATSHTTGKVGFSIYVVSEAEEELPMFMYQAAPSRVYTPYGEITWKVWYAPKHFTETLFPRQPTATWRVSAARPIPTNSTQQQQQQQQQQQRPLQYAQSAPTCGMLMAPLQQQQQQQQVQQYHQKQQADELSPLPTQSVAYHAARSPVQRARSYFPERELVQRSSRPPVMRSLSGVDQDHYQHRIQEGTRASFERANSAATSSSPFQQQPQQQPERVLSGLSLALMADGPEQEQNQPQGDGRPAGNDVSEPSVSEKRRAALHHAPPQFAVPAEASASPSRHNPAAEYGYAYNSHIPWQQIRPSTTTPLRVSPANTPVLSSSPNHWVSHTPPLGALSATPPSLSLLPPAKTAATPPFAAHPTGFVCDAATSNQNHVFQHQQPVLAANQESQHRQPQILAPLTSLDLLHCSPFQQSASLFSSLSVGGGGIGDPSAAASGMMRSENMRQSLWNASIASLAMGTDHGGQNDLGDDGDDMPFAVEDWDAHGTKTSTHLTSSSTLAAASFVQKCSTANHRLEMFDQSQRDADDVSNLADQLAEFKNFGASLLIEGNSTDGDAAYRFQQQQQPQQQSQRTMQLRSS